MTKQEKKRKKELDSKERNQSLTINEWVELLKLNKLYEKHKEKVNKRIDMALFFTLGMLCGYLTERLF